MLDHSTQLTFTLSLRPFGRLACRWPVAVVCLLLLHACATNPVTGRSELSLMSTRQELAIGEQNYLPTQQSQGGELRIDPELSAYVQEIGNRLAAVSDRELPYEFVVLNNPVPNAWALPGGKIAINRGLLTELENEAELAAVLGHEIVHAAARHTARAQTQSMVLQGALIAGAIGVRNNDYANLIIGGAALGSQLIQQRYGRDAERESDYYGTQYMLRAGYDPRGAVTLMEKFLALAEGRQQSWLEGLFASHPPSRERLENARAQVAAMDLAGLDLEVGTERYRQQLAFLNDSQPAYDLMDEAYAAAREDDLEVALDKLDQASALLPREARFDGLRGDILLAQRRYRAAIEAYDSAVDKDDQYFNYYLGRGVANARLGNRQQARADLQRSSELLPTATAALELGNLALEANDRLIAKQYFQAATQAQGRIGEQARLAYTRLDMGDNPGNYVQAQVGTDSRGRLQAVLLNSGPLTATDIEIEFQARTGGQIQTRSRRISVLEPGASVRVFSGLVLPAAVAANAANFQVRVIAARAR